jgi:hypothetical protein
MNIGSKKNMPSWLFLLKILINFSHNFPIRDAYVLKIQE